MSTISLENNILGVKIPDLTYGTVLYDVEKREFGMLMKLDGKLETFFNSDWGFDRKRGDCIWCSWNAENECLEFRCVGSASSDPRWTKHRERFYRAQRLLVALEKKCVSET